MISVDDEVMGTAISVVCYLYSMWKEKLISIMINEYKR